MGYPPPRLRHSSHQPRKRVIGSAQRRDRRPFDETGDCRLNLNSVLEELRPPRVSSVKLVLEQVTKGTGLTIWV